MSFPLLRSKHPLRLVYQYTQSSRSINGSTDRRDGADRVPVDATTGAHRSTGPFSQLDVFGQPRKEMIGQREILDALDIPGPGDEPLGVARHGGHSR